MRCDKYVNVNALIKFLKTSSGNATPDDITRRIIEDNIPATFDAVPQGSHKGPALAICDRNPDQLPAVSEGAIVASPASADGHGVPSGAPRSSTAGAAQQSREIRPVEQDLHIASPSPAPPASGGTPGSDPADFLSIPLIHMLSTNIRSFAHHQGDSE